MKWTKNLGLYDVRLTDRTAAGVLPFHAASEKKAATPLMLESLSDEVGHFNPTFLLRCLAPLQILCHIFRYLAVTDLLALERVSRRFRRIVRDDSIWIPRLLKVDGLSKNPNDPLRTLSKKVFHSPFDHDEPSPSPH